MSQMETGKYYSLGRRTFLLFIIQRSILAVLILILAILIKLIIPPLESNYASILNVATKIIIFLAIIVEIIGIIATRLQYGISKIMIDHSSLKIVRGILSKEQLELPYRRIESVEIKQTLLQRWFGVGHVVISTITDLNQPSQNEKESDNEVIPLMDYPLARAVADALTDRAEVEEMQIQQKISADQK